MKFFEPQTLKELPSCIAGTPRAGAGADLWQVTTLSYGDSSAVAVKLITLSSAVRMRTRFRTLCLHGRMSERRIVEIRKIRKFTYGKEISLLINLRQN